MKILALCIAMCFMSGLNANAFPLPLDLDPALEQTAEETPSEHSHDHTSFEFGIDATAARSGLTEADTEECQMPEDFAKAGEEYAGCYDCMFPPEWRREVAADLAAMQVADAGAVLNFVKAGKDDGKKRVVGKMVYPVVGGARFLSGLGDRRSGGRRHQGVDLGAKMGTPIVAVWPGRVVKAGKGGIGGWAVRVDHPNGYTTYYAHLKGAPLVRNGQMVSAGQKIGYVGMSGNARGTTPHLHFEVRSGRRVMNPLAYIHKGGKSKIVVAENDTNKSTKRNKQRNRQELQVEHKNRKQNERAEKKSERKKNEVADAETPKTLFEMLGLDKKP